MRGAAVQIEAEDCQMRSTEATVGDGEGWEYDEDAAHEVDDASMQLNQVSNGS